MYFLSIQWKIFLEEEERHTGAQLVILFQIFEFYSSRCARSLKFDVRNIRENSWKLFEISYPLKF